ncbi:NADPH-dependent FMN reductase [Chelatococcus asaccharovorans]|uniref:Chromate reductase n=1 Tax=Chelatococcus asaccharovorans TaxID=28210 RepID=A0A2V3TU98_9HYPH|nr:NADPH-dependent FMN reductase [Chelatococcus asaccharovorans]MBS7704974.1 NAD(P)H-dependent oxidoreductase [Chelatococcus asaccharovorans]PXW51888.1 chromate reductase [Chelatococcus asaccharovorans]CAH1651601.1 Quinone reductase [Chelatococcus asaccharovorans]CAH1686575.1 Quinone reductase [Chelatococcus asaccharovorans]
MTRTIAILEGSLRKASLSRVVARAAAGLSPAGLEFIVLPNPGTLPHYDQDVMAAGVPAAVEAMARPLSRADALLIVTPEYNWSIPGALKNAIDWLSRLSPNPLEGKPAAIWSVSPGLLGGARAHGPIRHVLHSQDMRVMAKPEVQIGAAREKIDIVSGTISDETSRSFLTAHLTRFRDFIAASV